MGYVTVIYINTDITIEQILQRCACNRLVTFCDTVQR